MRIACIFLLFFSSLVQKCAASCGTREGEYILDGSTKTSSVPTNLTEFKQNLHLVLEQLPTNITKINMYGWVGVYFGVDPNAVYSQARCIGFVDDSTCYNCILNATTVLKNDCSEEAISAFLWYAGDYCMVEYSNHFIINSSIMQMPEKLIRIKINSGNVLRPDTFNVVRTKLFETLAKNAETYVLGVGRWSDYSSKYTIFGVAQCAAHLSNDACRECFLVVGKKLETHFHGKLGGSIVGPSCNFRYEVNPFISKTYLFKDYTPSSGSGKRSNKALPLIYIIVALFLIFSNM